MSYHQQNVFVTQPETNGLGTAGFIVSLLSFFLCGLSSPIGLLMSLLALAWRPRGMAFAGVILGGLGSLWLFFAGFAILAGIVGIGSAASAEAERLRKEDQAKAATVAPADVEPAPSLDKKSE